MNKSTIVKRATLSFLIGLIILQFFPKNKNNAEKLEIHPLFENSNVSESVVKNFDAACSDCHSNHTEYPWYAKIAPVSFLIDNHVKEGKKHFNADEWNNYSLKRKNHKLEECIEMMEEGEMPMKGYVLIHKEADLSSEEKQEMISWFKSAMVEK